MSNGWMIDPKPHRRGATAFFVALAFCVPSGALLASAATALADGPGPELQDDFDGVADIDAIAGAAQTAFGDRYGGTFIDRSVEPAVLRVTVVSPAPADSDTLAQISSSNARVQIGSANSSKTSLDNARTAIETELQDALGSQQWSVGIDNSTQQIVVATSQLSEAMKQRLSAMAPPGAVRFNVADNFEYTLLNSSRDSYPPYEAGLVVQAALRCTTAFTLRKDGNHYGTTAGHCGPRGTPVLMGRPPSFVSNIGLNSFFCCRSSNSDAARFFIPSSAASARIYTAPGSHRTVIGRFSNAALTFGRRLCFQGSSSGNNNCGAINEEDTTVQADGVRTIRHLWCVGRSALPGDSGGPFYGVNSDGSARAAGILSGSTVIGATVSTCFSTMSYVLEYLGGTLVTG